ncbi:MAG: hypothetical protein ACI9FJ_002713, partial [Alteromonadaceae bacterium]
PYLPTFWPARVPNNILNQAMYEQTMDTSLPEQQREQAFAYRQLWLDDLPIEEPVTYTKQINAMIDHFDSLAVVQSKPGVVGDKNFPPHMQVGVIAPDLPKGACQGATLRSGRRGSAMHGETHVRKVDLTTIDKVHRTDGRHK